VSRTKVAAAGIALVVLAAGAVHAAEAGPRGSLANRNVTVQVVGSGLVTSSPGGISCPSQCTLTTAQGVIVTLTETPGPQPPSPLQSWTFHGWENVCRNAKSTCAFKLNNDATVRAVFVGAAVTRVAFDVKWKRSVPTGAFNLAYSVSNPATLTGTLTSPTGKAQTFDLSRPAAGAYTYSFKIPKTNYYPGKYALSIAGNVSGPSFPIAPISTPVVFQAPKEGVVARAWISAFGGTAPVQRLPKTAIGATAHFVFAANPYKGSTVTATWLKDGKRFFGPVGKPRTKNVTSFVGVKGGHLPAGFYTCVLRARGVVVKQVGVEVG
jgi:hypothetical protein